MCVSYYRNKDIFQKHAASGTLYSLYCNIHDFTWTTGPAGACIPVASASQIHVFPIQHILKNCGVHKHSLYIIYNTHT